jgi:hypothetical protein
VTWWCIQSSCTTNGEAQQCTGPSNARQVPCWCIQDLCTSGDTATVQSHTRPMSTYRYHRGGVGAIEGHARVEVHIPAIRLPGSRHAPVPDQCRVSTGSVSDMTTTTTTMMMMMMMMMMVMMVMMVMMMMI